MKNTAVKKKYPIKFHTFKVSLKEKREKSGKTQDIKRL
jgi:hypothetical protein